MKRAIQIAAAVILLIANHVAAGNCDNRNETSQETKIKPIYFILGSLDEYMGRTITEKGSVVESFYSSEAYASQIFEHYLNQLKQDESINTIIEKKTSDGGHIIFISPAIRQRIIEMYPHSFDNCKEWRLASNGEKSCVSHSFISLEFFKKEDKEAKLSYLAGAYARYGNRFGDEDDFSFHFANAGHKVKVVAELLKEFSCTNVQIENSNAFGPPYKTPTNFTVTFVSSPEITRIFQAVSKQLNGKDRVGRWVTK